MKNDNKPQNSAPQMPIFMCIGISVGMAIGAPFGNIPIGMCIGIGAGVCIGGITDHLNRKKPKDNNFEDNSDN